jgi:UDP-2,3-diacylglucosamine pyrophosphatase LpxH
MMKRKIKFTRIEIPIKIKRRYYSRMKHEIYFLKGNHGHFIELNFQYNLVKYRLNRKKDMKKSSLYEKIENPASW